ncbi:MAG: pantoate--beta-alanine ligase [Planctomycetaceae bacterium]
MSDPGLKSQRPLARVVRTVDELREAIRVARRAGQSVGCVPTMGALHAGHRSLVAASAERCDFSVVTIFVNPTQFAPTEDLEKYPRTFDEDLQLCSATGADLVYAPEVASLYPPGYSTWVTVEGVSETLEGASRPTHFRGVTTIVMKLFNLVQPDVAFFGAKDYQQQTLIRRMVKDLDLPVEIVVCPTVREVDGLAMSSRNRYLTPDEHARSALSLSARPHADLEHACRKLGEEIRHHRGQRLQKCCRRASCPTASASAILKQHLQHLNVHLKGGWSR